MFIGWLWWAAFQRRLPNSWDEINQWILVTLDPSIH
jgi:hypothetical protein